MRLFTGAMEYSNDVAVDIIFSSDGERESETNSSLRWGSYFDMTFLTQLY